MEYTIKNKERISDNVLEEFFINRGFNKEDIFHYLNTTDEDILSPLLLDNMAEGAEMLLNCIYNNKKIFIIPDVDADGFTSASILMNYIFAINPNFAKENILYEINEDKEHGIILGNIPEGVSLVVCPDSGSSDYIQHAHLKGLGINTLVLDHHELTDGVSKDACIINNQACAYPNKSLSGAGVVYKFCCYLDSILNVNYADNFLDLTALGLISDMVSLKDFETRHLVKKGLANIRNPFFKTMQRKNSFSLGDTLTPMGIAFYITPYINATIRMGSKSEKRTLFESMLDFKAYENIPSTKRGCKGQEETRVEQACRNCTNIKNRQTRARDASLIRIEELINNNNLLNNKLLVVTLPKSIEFDKNLTGLIANQLMAKYQKPTLLLREGEDEFTGSARGIGNSDFNNFKGFIESTELFTLAQGHAQAFGASIPKDKVTKFIEVSNNLLADCDFKPCYNADFVFYGDDFRGDDILALAELESYFGQGVEEPYIVIENLSVTKDNVTLMSRDKNPTLKIQLPNGCSLIRFKSSEEEFEKLYSNLGCVKVNVVGRCKRNVWNGTTTPQVIIEDYEIIGKQSYYF